MDPENLAEPSSPDIFPRTPSQFSTRPFTQVNKNNLLTTGTGRGKDFNALILNEVRL